jgi:hypothetical protein
MAGIQEGKPVGWRSQVVNTVPWTQRKSVRLCNFAVHIYPFACCSRFEFSWNTASARSACRTALDKCGVPCFNTSFRSQLALIVATNTFGKSPRAHTCAGRLPFRSQMVAIEAFPADDGVSALLRTCTTTELPFCNPGSNS